MKLEIIVGNLGGDCRMGSAGGSLVCNFRVAVESGYGQNKQTNWYDCAYWGKGGEAVSQYLTKGQQVVVIGETTIKPANGNHPASFAMRVDRLKLCGAASGNSGHSTAPVPSTTDDAIAEQSYAEKTKDFDDDIPF